MKKQKIVDSENQTKKCNYRSIDGWKRCPNNRENESIFCFEHKNDKSWIVYIVIVIIIGGLAFLNETIDLIKNISEMIEKTPTKTEFTSYTPTFDIEIPTTVASLTTEIYSTQSPTPILLPTVNAKNMMFIYDGCIDNSWSYYGDPTNKNIINTQDCLDLSDIGIVSGIDQRSNKLGVNIRVEKPKGNEATEQYIRLDVNDFVEIEAIVHLYNIESYKGDVDLILGIGPSPNFNDNKLGKFIVFRVTQPDSAILVCSLFKWGDYCAKEFRSDEIYSLNNISPIKIDLLFVNPITLDIKYKGNSIYNQKTLLVTKSSRILWIGYRIFSGGSIDAFIEIDDKGSN
jgi:hypothetical protein